MNRDTTIHYEVQGFDLAMELLNAECRLDWSRQMVLEFADQMYNRLRPSQYGQGFMDAAKIVARTRPNRV